MNKITVIKDGIVDSNYIRVVSHDKYDWDFIGDCSIMRDRTYKLQDYVRELYKNNYWDVFELDEIPSQIIAYQMFDTCVNCGEAAAIRFAQASLGERIDGRWTLSLLHKLAAIHS